MRYPIPAFAKRMAREWLFPIPPHLAKSHRPVSADGLQAIATSLQNHFPLERGMESTDTGAVYERNLQTHLYTRLEKDRRRIVPWLDSARSLRDTRILEIGCGTGSSTVTLAEQGAKVTGIDIDAGAMMVAQDRCRAYGVEAEFQILNAEGIARAFGPIPST